LRIEEQEGTAASQSEIRNPKSAIVKILDFGLAGFATEVGEAEIRADKDQDEIETATALQQLTEHGTMMGTPDYIAPEQADDPHAADIRADIYSLGCTLFTLLAGRAPFAEGSVLDKIKAHSQQAPPSISQIRADVPAEVEAILQKMLAKNPADRYQSPAELAAALVACESAWQTAKPPSHASARRSWPRPSVLVAAAAVFVGIAAAVVYYIQTDYGTVRVEVADENVEVTLAGNTITTQNDNQSLTIRAGKQKLIVRRGNFKFETESFQLRREGEVALKVELLAGEFVVRKDGKPFGPRVRPQGAATPDSRFFSSLSDLPAVVKKTLTDEGLTIGPTDLSGPGVSNSRSVIALDAELSGEGDQSRKVIRALRNQFMFLSSGSDASFSNLESEMHGITAGAYLPYSAGQRVGQVRIELRRLFADKREPKINRWNLHIQIEEWRKKGDSPQIAAEGNQSDKPSQYFEHLAGEPLESAVRERVGGDVGRRIAAERIPQPPGRIRYEAQIDGVGSKILEDVFVDLCDLVMRGTDAKVVHTGEQGIGLRLLRFTTPTHNGEVRVTLTSRELGGQPADESTKWLLKIEASEWLKGKSQATPSMVRVERKDGTVALYLDGAPLSREEVLARVDALATGDPGFQVHVEGDVVPVTKDVMDLIKAIGATAVGEQNARFPPQITRQIMDDAVQHGKAMRAATQLVEVGRFAGHEGGINHATVSPDGKYGISGGQDKTVRVWELETRKEKFVLKGHADVVWGLDVSPDGKTLASSDRARSIRLWNLETGEARGELTGHTDAVTDLAFLPDGTLLSAGFDETLRLWNIERRELVRTIELGANVEKMAPLWDGKRVMLSGAHTMGWGMLTYDLEKGERISPTPSAQSCLAVSADQRKVLVGSVTGLMRVTDMESGELVVQLADPRANAARDAAISADGRYAITTTREGSMHLWDLHEGKLLTTASGDTIGTITLSPDGRFALTVGRGGEAGVWRLPESVWLPDNEKGLP
jgi:sugar lactone lactonase YvrE